MLAGGGRAVELHALRKCPSAVCRYVDCMLIALPSSVSQPQTVKRAPATQDMDEDSQLELALSLSKEEHKQVGFILRHFG